MLAWKIPWTEEPGGLQSMGLQKSWMRLSDLNNNTLSKSLPSLYFIQDKRGHFSSAFVSVIRTFSLQALLLNKYWQSEIVIKERSLVSGSIFEGAILLSLASGSLAVEINVIERSPTSKANPWWARGRWAKKPWGPLLQIPTNTGLGVWPICRWGKCYFQDEESKLSKTK